MALTEHNISSLIHNPAALQNFQEVAAKMTEDHVRREIGITAAKCATVDDCPDTNRPLPSC